MREQTYFVAGSVGGGFVGTLTTTEIRDRLANESLPKSFVCLSTIATGDVNNQWRRLDSVFGPDGVLLVAPRPRILWAWLRVCGLVAVIGAAAIAAWWLLMEGGDPKAGQFSPADQVRLTRLSPCLPAPLRKSTPFKEQLPESESGRGPHYQATTVGAKLLELGAWCDNGTLRARDGRPIYLVRKYEVGTGYDPRIARDEQERIVRMQTQGVVVVMYSLHPVP